MVIHQTIGDKIMKTDRELQKDVIDELGWEPSVDAAHIGVEVENGIVTLSGHVDSYPQRWSAERAALRVAGVKGVAVEIAVELPGLHKRNDADLARTARSALEWNVSVPDKDIKLTVKDGWITLSGEVDWAYQRWAAVAAVRDLVGVAGVNDEIVIKTHVQSKDVKVKIESALQRLASREAKAIKVDIDREGSVTLSGRVDSWSERNAARHAAWAAPGVKNVVDRISVSA